MGRGASPLWLIGARSSPGIASKPARLKVTHSVGDCLWTSATLAALHIKISEIYRRHLNTQSLAGKTFTSKDDPAAPNHRATVASDTLEIQGVAQPYLSASPIATSYWRAASNNLF